MSKPEIFVLMKNMLKKAKTLLLSLTVFLFPIFFLTTIQDPFVTNKLYLLAFSALVLMLLSTLEFIQSKKIILPRRRLDKYLVLFLLALGLSILLVSPNKPQALLNINLGMIKILPLLILYHYLSTHPSQRIKQSFYAGALAVGLISALFFFQPFRNVNLPSSWQILKLPQFTPLGNYLELSIYLGFVVVWEASFLLKKKKLFEQQLEGKANLSFLVIHLLLLVGALMLLFLPLKNQQSLLNMVFYPLRLSWYSTVEIIKNPLTAVFGIGVDNYSAIFTRVKDIAYNQSSLWQIGYFTISRTLLLHIFTETGFFGLAAFCLMFYHLARQAVEKHSLYFPLVIFMGLVIFFLPPGLVSLFLLFLLAAWVAQAPHQPTIQLSLPLSALIAVVVVSLALIGAGVYLSVRSYLAEYYYQKASEGIKQNNIKTVYDNLKTALILNPFSEKFATDFSRLNLQYAINLIISKNQKKEVLNDQEKTAVTQAIQQAILEAKRVVNLNPQKAANWENLALIYKNIINIAQGADMWTISAYQRAIMADPQNPLYRISLGGVYYALNNFEEAIKYFEQAIALKPDWPNAYYNLAWANYQQNNLNKAVNAMENVVKLLNKSNNQADLAKAKADYENFKNKLEATSVEKEASEEGKVKAEELKLPEKPVEVDPKLPIKDHDPHDPE